MKDLYDQLYVHTHIHIYLHTQMQTHTHAHTHTYTHLTIHKHTQTHLAIHKHTQITDLSMDTIPQLLFGSRENFYKKHLLYKSTAAESPK